MLLPLRSPNLNAHIERFMRSIKSEGLERMIFFGEAPLRRALAECVAHHHGERNHQGLGNGLIEPGAEVGRVEGGAPAGIGLAARFATTAARSRNHLGRLVFHLLRRSSCRPISAVLMLS